MRPDFKEVLITRPRSGGHGSRKTQLRPKKDFEHLPEQEGIRRPYNKGWNRKEFTDHISPLKRWLRKQVGRPWNKIWSEICQVVDARDIIGKHLLDHVKGEVQTDQVIPRFSYERPLYVDKKGFLRQRKEKWKGVYKPPPPDRVEIDGIVYQKIGKNWFKVVTKITPVGFYNGQELRHVSEYRTQLSVKRIKALGLS